jgi:uncharacterized protein YidB (DUF937 family)
MVISEVFRDPVPAAPLAGPVMLLEGLQAGIAGQLAVLDNAGLTGTGQSSADVLGVPGTVLADRLTDHLVREIIVRGSAGGPLTPLASQFNHELTRLQGHLQGQRIEGMLARLAGEVRTAPPRPDGGATVHRTHGCPIAQWNPVKLGVHQVIGGGSMPMYIRRPHDELLWAVLDPAVPASRLVVVRGGSSTGKTRAAYEAVAGQLADWQLDYPLNVAALKERLDTGIPARTVLWLGELRQYADAEGGAEVLGRLADLLTGEGYLLITTVWLEHWNTYTAAARTGPGAADPVGTVGRLLDGLPELTGRDLARLEPARGGVIDVPPEFTETDLQAAARTGDPALADAAEAAASAGQVGQVTQYLAGVPDLLDRYDGPGGDPYGQTVISAAMDATRLGHASPLPAALLQEGAVGYLTDAQRTKDIAIWRETALTWAAEELRGAVRAVRPVPPPSGTGIAGYRVADYLDQHGRRTRQDQLGPLSLWDALTARVTSALDLTRLGEAARARGLYRHAAALWTAAAALGSADAARRLIDQLRKVSPSDIMRAAQWTVGQVSLDDPASVGVLLGALRRAEAGDAVRTLLDRDPVAQASLDRPSGVSWLLGELRGAGADDAARALADRAAGQVSLDDPLGVAVLLGTLRQAGADDAARTLGDRAAAQVSLDRLTGVAWLLGMLRGAGDAVRALADRAAAQAAAQAGFGNPGDVAMLLGMLDAAEAGDAVQVLADRAAGQASLDDLAGVAELLRELRQAGAGDAARTLADRAAGQASLDDSLGVAVLLRELRQAGAGDAVRTLLDRDPAARASLDRLTGVAWLLGELREAGAGDAARTLGDQAAAQASLGNPYGVAELLRELRQAGAGDAVRTLLDRDPAAQASLDDPGDVAELLRELRQAGAGDAARTLADRAANAGMFDLFLEVQPEEASNYLFGREPDGTPSQPWRWEDRAS